MPKKIITIEATFGSEFQVGFVMRTLEKELAEWVEAMREHHKGNNATWTITDVEPEQPGTAPQ